MVPKSEAPQYCVHGRLQQIKGSLVNPLQRAGLELAQVPRVPGTRRIFGQYTQYPIIRNGLIRNGAEFWGKFKKRALGQSNLRNASKNLRNAQCSDFQI